jgi:hypothetical protein
MLEVHEHSSFIVRRLAQQVAKNPATSSKAKYDSSDHNGQVFHFHARVMAHIANVTDEGERYDKVAAATLHAFRADLVARGADLRGLLLTPECIKLYSKGVELPFFSSESPNETPAPDWQVIDSCDMADFRMWDCALHRVSSHKYKDLFYTLFKSYGLISQPYIANLAPGEQNLFINRGTCGL